MRILVTGGSASGKSSYAEGLAAKLPLPRWYVATMQPFDDECRRRIQKHQKQRVGLGFTTLECPLQLQNLKIPQRGTVLLECMSNLVANEMFDPKGAGPKTLTAVLNGIEKISTQAEHLIVVTNDVFGDGCGNDAATLEYLQTLGAINHRLARQFDAVYEVVCGIAICHKGGET